MKFQSIFSVLALSVAAYAGSDGTKILTRNKTFTPDEMVSVSDVFGSSEWIAVPKGTPVEINDGTLIRWSGGTKLEAFSNGKLEAGLYQNLSSLYVFVTIGGTPEVIPPYGLIGVGGVIVSGQTEAPPSTRRCSVTCGTGFYACCNYGNTGGSPTCKCKRVTVSNVPCDGGGEGSTTCELEQDVIPMR